MSKSAYMYAELADGRGNVSTITTTGVLYEVVHFTLDGRVALCGHGLRDAEKLQSLRRNWVYVTKPANCEKCLAVKPRPGFTVGEWDRS